MISRSLPVLGSVPFLVQELNPTKRKTGPEATDTDPRETRPRPKATATSWEETTRNPQAREKHQRLKHNRQKHQRPTRRATATSRHSRARQKFLKCGPTSLPRGSWNVMPTATGKCELHQTPSLDTEATTPPDTVPFSSTRTLSVHATSDPTSLPAQR